jgi:hypothetical protein
VGAGSETGAHWRARSVATSVRAVTLALQRIGGGPRLDSKWQGALSRWVDRVT